jgi:alkylation response protein AidB-like acyl-CoA dehydrogenase
VTGGTAALLADASASRRRELLPRVARGALRPTLAIAEESARFDADGVALPARPASGGFVLTGEKHFVADAHLADLLVVAARTAGGVTLCLVDRLAPGVTVTPLRTVDMSRRICRVTLDGVRVAPDRVLAGPERGAAVLARAVQVMAAGLAAEMVGTAEKALDRTVAYVKERVQFGRAVGSFQAVKHACVDMMVAVENARSLAYYAAWAVDGDVPEARHAVAMAKAYASDMVKQVTSEAIQLHGGIGFTWEHDMHLYHRRALAQEAALGSAPVHRAVVAETFAP